MTHPAPAAPATPALQAASLTPSRKGNTSKLGQIYLLQASWRGKINFGKETTRVEWRTKMELSLSELNIVGNIYGRIIGRECYICTQWGWLWDLSLSVPRLAVAPAPRVEWGGARYTLPLMRVGATPPTTLSNRVAPCFVHVRSACSRLTVNVFRLFETHALLTKISAFLVTVKYVIIFQFDGRL